MLKVVMRLEERVTRVELYEDAADAPDVTREAPTKIENDFRRSVVPC